MAINERLVHTASAAAAGTGNQEEGLILHLDANDVDSYDGDGDVWYDIHDHEYTPATNVSEHFNTVTWSGDGASTRSITGVGFQPDLVWVKARQAQNYTLYDSVRGTGRYLASDGDTAEITSTTYGQLTSFDSDGFTGSEGSNQTYSFFNSSSQTYVAWCFNAGGNEVTNTEGTIDSTVRANNDLGFSIVKYTGNNTSGATVGHGLNSAPELVIIKTLQTGPAYSGWAVQAAPLGGDKYLWLDQTNGQQSSAGYFNNTLADSNVITLGNFDVTNDNTDLIAYCFTSKRGVSKVGSYEGNYSSTGVKVYTGFEPAWILVKPADSNVGWSIHDNKRGVDKQLKPNSNAAETTGWGAHLEFHGDGFKVKGSSSGLNPASTMIYLAFAAEKPSSLIDDTDLNLHLDPASYSGSGSTWTADVGSDGTLVGNTSYDQELGDFFDLDGSGDYISLNSSGYLTGDFTVEMWWNFDTLSGFQMLWGGQGYSGGTGLGHYIDGNTLHTYISVSGAASSPTGQGGAVLTVGKWHHIVITRSGGTYTQYVDGTNVGSGTGSTVSLESVNTYIGAHYNNTAYNVDGRVGQVRVYNSALTQDQVRQNFNFTRNDYPNGFNADLTSLTHNPNGYFTYDSTSDKAVIANGKTKGLVPNSSTDTTTLIWARIHSTSPLNYLLTGRNQGSSINNFYFRHYNNNLTLAIYDDGGTRDINQNFGSLSANTWYLLGFRTTTDGSVRVHAITTGSSTFTDATATMSSYESTDVDFNIGYYQTSYGLDGDIGKVSVYNKYLSDSEITAHYEEYKSDFGLS